ncbi:disintegrin and metalloproteinase domain-containing protein 15 isoform X2 [Varanus komodoensis]|uniref:disintegrin and metalloproteinase domain-containing protein 15 isoform X2 n=1 Tax=Varanus komodoensis TaxID=61221 RepID=UPI001CF7B0BE|nr:disintegrin and metalloproteinase domain-containing protein 15 isoform X2 [Varanus komodoensis]
MALLWRLGLLLASCGGFGEPRSAPGRGGPVPGAGSGAWGQGGDRTCSWTIVPKVLQGEKHISLKRAMMGQKGFPTWLQVVLEVEGEHLQLDLVQNWELLAGTRGLVYYLHDGTRATHQTAAEGNCCYRGDVVGYPDGWANICLCSGLSGFLVVSSDRSYSLESSDEERTRIYRLEAVRQGTGECKAVSLSQGQHHPQRKAEQTVLHRAKRETEPEHGYVELVIVANLAEFKLDPDINRTQIRMLEIVSHMDGFFRTLDLRVAFVGCEVWTDRDHVATSGPLREVLERFLQWRQKELLPRIPHDNAQLIIGSPFRGGLIGASTQGSICSGRSGGVTMDYSVSPLAMASALSHQLGHNLGLNHDGAGCGCDGSSPKLPPGHSCIMEPLTGMTPGLSFSSCSQWRIEQVLQSDRAWCLREEPDPARLVGPFCGNRIVESSEECDCGLRLECADPCCNATTCKLMPGAQCATGQACCHECKIRSAGFVCREAQNDCDLPEFCSGVSPRCPANFHKQDGTPCEEGTAVCYNGICPTYLSQCQEFWGSDSVPVSDACVASLNRRGDAEGHCGQQANGSYIPCAKSDVWCGQLQCQGGGSAGAKKQNGKAQGPACLHNTPTPVADVLDLAMVLPGTACGPSKVCVEKRCRPLSSLKLPACQCNGHGVCNNEGHCHCQPGWAPPDCRSAGLGGSVDGGSPAAEQAGTATSTALLLTALSLALVLAVGFCCARRVGLYKRLCQFSKGTSCQYRNEAESRVRFIRPAEPRGITQPEGQSYSHAPPERPRPPRWRPNTEMQLVPSSKPRSAARPLPPRKPLPSDPPRAETGAAPGCSPQVQMLPSRPAPPPPPAASGSSTHVHKI